MVGLRNCPFCGAFIAPTENEIIVRADVSTLRWVRCRACRADGPVGQSAGEAVELWNYRAGADQLCSLLAEIMEEAEAYQVKTGKSVTWAKEARVAVDQFLTARDGGL